MMIDPNNRSQHKQKGAALVVSLFILVILTVLGVSSMRTTVLEERMTGNARNQAIAQLAAETALRDAEIIVDEDITHKLYFGTPAGHFDDKTDEPDILDATQWAIAANARDASTIVAGSTPAKMMIKNAGEYLGEGSLNAGIGGYDQPGTGSEPPSYIRVTTRGLGGDGVSTVVLQTYVVDRLR